MTHILIRVLALLVIVLAMADIYSTNRALTVPGVREANPLMRWFMAVFGPRWVLPRMFMALLSVGGVILLSDDGGRAVVTLAVNNLVVGYAVWNNLSLVARRK